MCSRNTSKQIIETPLQLQIYYELALAVGNSGELQPMLKQSVSAYLRKLNCSAGMVLSTHYLDQKASGFKPLFSLPKRISQDPAVQLALEGLPPNCSRKEQDKILARLPMVVATQNAMQIHIMDLPRFGVILLVKSGNALPEHVVKSLLPINRRLAEACLASIQNKEVEQLVVQLQHEVKEREKTQIELGLSKQKYQTIFQNIQDVYFETSCEGTILEVSPSVEKVLGYKREGLLGTSIADVYHDEKERNLLIANLTPDESMHDQELLVRNNRGDAIMAAINATLKESASGKPVKIIGSMRDISKRKQAETALQLEKDKALETAAKLEIANKELLKLHRALEQSPVAVVITDSNGLIEYVNPAFCRISGYSAQEARGKTPRFLKSDATGATEPGDLWKTLKAGNIWQGEFCNKGEDGSLFWEQAFIHPVKNDDGQITHFITLTEDITWRKTAEAKLARAQDEIDAANAARSEFLANMSHEIRTPLNGLIGMTALLLDSDLSTEQQGMATTIRTSADSLMTAMNNILDYAKIMANQLTLDDAQFDLQQLFEDTSAIVRPQLENRPLNLNFDIAPDLPMQVSGDGVRLKQVLINLIDNAIKFTDKGEVTVALTQTSEDENTATYRIAVRDTGIGIAEEFIPRLFKHFSQHDTSLSRKYGGTGLGLAICKSLIEAMGGCIGVESRKGEGSTFWFEICLVKQPRSRRSHASEPAADQALCATVDRSAYRILVVEDNPVNRIIALKLLEKLGYGCEAVTNGLEAVEVTEEQRFDLILMDIQMPEMDGLQATRAIRARNGNGSGSQVPIVALTAHAMKGDRKLCLEAGMDDYLPKPVNRKQLAVVIEKFLPC